jgi:hypothetical protein
MDSVPVSCFAPDPLWDSIGDEASRKTAAAAAILILRELVIVAILDEIEDCKTILHLHKLRGASVTEVLMVEGADGYEIVFAVAETDLAFATREIILADERK